MNISLSKFANHISYLYKSTVIYPETIDYKFKIYTPLSKEIPIEEALAQCAKPNNFTYQKHGNSYVLSKIFDTKTDLFNTNYEEVCAILRDIIWSLQYIGGDRESEKLIYDLYEKLPPERKAVLAQGTPISNVSPSEFYTILKMATSLRYSGIIRVQNLLRRLILAKRPECYFSKIKYPGLAEEITSYRVTNYFSKKPLDILLFSHIYTQAGGGFSTGGSYNDVNNDLNIDENTNKITILKSDPTTPAKGEHISYQSTFPNNLQTLAELLSKKDRINIIISPRISWKPVNISGEEFSSSEEILQACSNLYNLSYEKLGNTIRVFPFRSNLVTQPKLIPSEIRKILPTSLIRFINSSVSDGSIHTPTRNLTYKSSIRDLRNLIEPFNPSEQNRIYLKNAPKETLDLLASASIATCLSHLYEMMRHVPAYLEYFSEAFIKIQQDTSTPDFRLKFEITCQDEKKQIHVLKSEFTRFGSPLPAPRKK